MRVSLVVSLAVATLAGCGVTTYAPLQHGATSEAGAKAASSGASPSPRWFSSIVWLVMENHGYSQVDNLQSAQFLMKRGATLAQSYAVAHPSGPNYRIMVAGQAFSLAEIFTGNWPTVATEYRSLGIPTFDWYVQGTPALRHDPYQELVDPGAPIQPRTIPFDPELLPARCQVYLGFDDGDDAHSGSLAVADRNIMAILTALDRSKWFHTPDSTGHYPVFMETWDESYLGDQHVFTAFWGDGVKPGFTSQTRYDHMSVCRTLTDDWSLPLLGNAGLAPAIDDIWVAPPAR